MRKTDLVSKVAKKVGVSETLAKGVVDAVFDSIKECLCAREGVSIKGFGSFTIRNRAARTMRNPMTGESINVPEAKVPVFKASGKFKDDVNDVN